MLRVTASGKCVGVTKWQRCSEDAVITASGYCVLLELRQ